MTFNEIFDFLNLSKFTIKNFEKQNVGKYAPMKKETSGRSAQHEVNRTTIAFVPDRIQTPNAMEANTHRCHSHLKGVGKAGNKAFAEYSTHSTWCSRQPYNGSERHCHRTPSGTDTDV